MTKNQWRSRIKEQMVEVGTFKASFNPAIDTLAKILEQRDLAYKQYMDSGGEALVEVTTDRGATNMKKNPLLQIWQDLNSQALAFWRDLGLVPSALKKIDDGSMKQQKISPLTEALRAIG